MKPLPVPPLSSPSAPGPFRQISVGTESPQPSFGNPSIVPCERSWMSMAFANPGTGLAAASGGMPRPEGPARSLSVDLFATPPPRTPRAAQEQGVRRGRLPWIRSTESKDPTQPQRWEGACSLALKRLAKDLHAASERLCSSPLTSLAGHIAVVPWTVPTAIAELAYDQRYLSFHKQDALSGTDVARHVAVVARLVPRPTAQGASDDHSIGVDSLYDGDLNSSHRCSVPA